MHDERRFIAQRIGRLVARDPAGGIRRQDVIGEVGVREWKLGWGLAYGLGLIDFVGDYVVAPALPGPAKTPPKQARTTCTQTSVRDMLF